MTHQAPPSAADPGGDDAGRQVASLREVLSIVRGFAGIEGKGPAGDALLDEAARISAAYERASPVVQRRFDALAAETAGWATAGIEALLAAGPTPSPKPAERLAEMLSEGLADLTGLLRL